MPKGKGYAKKTTARKKATPKKKKVSPKKLPRAKVSQKAKVASIKKHANEAGYNEGYLRGAGQFKAPRSVRRSASRNMSGMYRSTKKKK